MSEWRTYAVDSVSGYLHPALVLAVAALAGLLAVLENVRLVELACVFAD